MKVNVSSPTSTPSLSVTSLQQSFTHLVKSSRLNGSHESQTTSRHFHISLVWLCVTRVCSGTLTGHCGQRVKGSTDSHCVKRMHPSLVSLDMCGEIRTSNAYFDATDRGPMEKNVPKYLESPLSYVFFLTCMTSATAHLIYLAHTTFQETSYPVLRSGCVA